MTTIASPQFLLQFLESPHFPVIIAPSSLTAHSYPLKLHTNAADSSYFVNKSALVAILPNNPLKVADRGNNTSPQVARVQIFSTHGTCVMQQYLIANESHSVLFLMKASYAELRITVYDSMEEVHEADMREMTRASTGTAHDESQLDSSTYSLQDSLLPETSLPQNQSFRMHMMSLDLSHRYLPMERILSNASFNDMSRKQAHLTEFYAPMENGFHETQETFTRLLKVSRIRVQVQMKNFYTLVKRLMMEAPPKPASPVQYLNWAQEKIRMIALELSKCENVIEIERDLRVLGIQQKETMLNANVVRYIRQLLSNRVELLLTSLQNRALDHVQGVDMLVFQRRAANRLISEWIGEKLPRLRRDFEAVSEWIGGEGDEDEVE